MILNLIEEIENFSLRDSVKLEDYLKNNLILEKKPLNIVNDKINDGFVQFIKTNYTTYGLYISHKIITNYDTLKDIVFETTNELRFTGDISKSTKIINNILSIYKSK